MTWLNFILDTVALYVSSDFFGSWFPYIFVVLFIALVPRLIHMIIAWR